MSLSYEEFTREEVRDGYSIDTRLKKIWWTELDILDKFMAICEKYNLKYFVSHGSLLGVIRHGGFIPWDDDIDVDMPREDFEKLCEVAEKELSAPYVFQCPYTETDFFLGFGRIRNCNTTGVFYGDCLNESPKGIYLDIFPRDGVIEDETLRRKQSEILEKYRMLNYAYCYQNYYYAYYAENSENWSKLIKEANALVDKHGRKWLMQQFVDACRMGNTGDEVRTAIHCLRTDYECCYWYKEDYEETIFKQFEDRWVPIPKNWDRCLRTKWKNYMEFPPVNQRGYKHLEHILDPDTSADKYPFEQFVDFPSFNLNRELILCGAGIACQDFLKRYADKYGIKYILDNNKNKQGTKIEGIPVCGVETISTLNAEDYQIILTTSYFEDFRKQLREYGISETYVYIKDWKYKV